MTKELEKAARDRHLWRDIWSLRAEFDGEKRLTRLGVRNHIVNLLKTIHFLSRQSIGFSARRLTDDPNFRQEGQFTLNSLFREYHSLFGAVQNRSLTREEVVEGIKHFAALGDYLGLRDAQFILDRNVRVPQPVELQDFQRIEIERQYLQRDKIRAQEATASILQESGIWQNLARYYKLNEKNPGLKINYQIGNFASYDSNARNLGYIFVPMSFGRFSVPFIVFNPLLDVAGGRHELQGSYDVQSVLGFEKDPNGALRLLAVRKINRLWDKESSQLIGSYSKQKFG